ncbi:MAG TPA: heme exporter protein CcmD [Alicycliphilus sp.]|uniref:Heme exporter protein D n=1 Tax=Diaphorobacter limosus TaxID=3036128 RepID=A0ABZ0J5V4_9BURK|nr:heme exporter protein CcmD [Diaphorobacter sp. Y-1]HRM48893.1 heme exporter protein CcmD [Alicycliphilus sp.]WOO33630.1 heme exporter protein CcmD [Diaphorobacter sp. Y-1]HRM92305.1 heme exporter protein CcmD [Alicycliphilus sp.]HRN63588.1 heme exporter protein CcmD [Alicycliphilus sp.]HRO52788.1 heme exporter protein CcmD [Alicycliphilus sp.]
MGGYAFYVWGSFGATALVMAVESLLIRGRRKQMQQSLRAELHHPTELHT